MYTLKDIMKMLEIPERTIRRHIKEKLLVGSKVGGVWKFTIDDLKSYMSDDRVSKHLINNGFKVVNDYYNGLIQDKSEVVYLMTREFKSLDSMESFLQVTKLFKYKFSIIGHGSLKSYRYTFKGRQSDVIILMKWSEEFEKDL